MALHHTGHGAKDRARGSSVFGADADTMVRLDRKTGANLVELTMTKQKDAAIWPDPLWAGLNHIPEFDTLVPVASNHKAAPPKKHSEAQSMMITDIVEEVMLEVLKGNPTKKWSERALSNSIAAHERIELGDEAVRRTHLRAIRSENKRRGHRCFDHSGTPQVWRYQD